MLRETTAGCATCVPAHATEPRRSSRTQLLLLFIAVAVAALLLAVRSTSASAGTINVWACQTPNGEPAPLDRWESGTRWAGIDLTNRCASVGGWFGVDVAAATHPEHSYGAWTFTAPPGTTVTAYSEFVAWQVSGWASFQSFRGLDASWTSAILMDLCQARGGCTSQPAQGRGFAVDHAAGVMLMLEACGPRGSDCDASSAGWVALSHATVTLEDGNPPTFSSLAGGLAAATPLRGNASITLQAADVGTGVYKVHATVDGRSFDDRIVDDNGGKCQPVGGARDFVYAVPCRPTSSVNTTLNTATLPDGTHTVDVKIEDASGNLTTVFHDDVATHNAPVMSTRPAVAGTPKLGQELNATPGTWSSPTTSTFGYQWARCPISATLPSDADGCSDIPGATRSTYLPIAADVYRKVMVRVTATNASGTGSAYSAPTDLVADAQGRTTLPPADQGGPRDVVVIPVPGPGGSSSSTTIIGGGGGSNPASNHGIAGLVNPLAGLPGHVANGSNASESARVRVAFEIRPRGVHRQVMSVRSSRSQRWVVKGQLSNAQGRPIGGGQLVAAWKINDRWTAHTGVKTLSNGKFTYVLPRGPSRQLKFVYYAFSDSRDVSSSNVLTEKVATPVTLKVTPPTATNKQTITFKGRVATDFMPRKRVLVMIEASYPGSGWKPVTSPHARRDGSFRATYTFESTSVVTRYRFRARCPEQAAYPFEGGTSRISRVLVTP